LGKVTLTDSYMDIHIDQVMNLPLVNVNQIKAANFKVIVDVVDSSDSVTIPKLLKEIGVTDIELYCEHTGDFPHNHESLKEHITDICNLVVEKQADMGIVVEPDVYRLGFITNQGEMFGEEYTLVACADFVLGKSKGNTVSNLSSSRALRDFTLKHGGNYQASAVGEVN